MARHDGVGAAPVHLCGLAGNEGEAEGGGMAHRAYGSHRAYGPHPGRHDAEAAGVALLAAQALIDPGDAVRVARYG